MVWLPFSVHEHVLKSRRVDQLFKVSVALPARDAQSGEQLPVLYATDADNFFGGLADMSAALQAHGEVERFVLVGIGYGDCRRAQFLRLRDFHTHAVRALYRTELETLSREPLYDGLYDDRVVNNTTDAVDFLKFIVDELMPFIASYYAVRPGDAGYYGFSAGGAFGFYALFGGPDVFRRYILASAVTSHRGQQFGIAYAQAVQRLRIDAKVFMSVGADESCDPTLAAFDIVSGFDGMARFLRHAALPGFQLETKILPAETHAGAWLSGFRHGVRALYGSRP